MEGIRQPILTYIYNRYHKASSTRDAVIELRIAYDNRQKYLSTRIRLFPKEWQRGRVVNRLDAAILNKTLDKLMNEVREVIYEMIEDGHIDIFAIPAKLAAKHRKAMTFIEFFQEKAELRKHGIGKIAQGRYDLVPRVLQEFGRITSFSDLTPHNIVALDKYLMKKGIKATAAGITIISTSVDSSRRQSETVSWSATHMTMFVSTTATLITALSTF